MRSIIPRGELETPVKYAPTVAFHGVNSEPETLNSEL